MVIGEGNKPWVLGIFVATYAALAVGHIPGLKLNRTGIAVLGAIAIMVAAGVSTSTALGCVNWGTIAMLFGFFVISAQLRLSGFYHRIADAVSARLGHPVRFLAFIIAVTAVLSAFLNNDVVCYVMVPVVGAALIERTLNPVPFLVALGTAANIGAGATLIGNGQNMMIGQLSGLGFLQYMAWALPPVLLALCGIFLVTWPALGSAPAALLPQEDPGPAESPDSHSTYHTVKGLVVLAAVIGLFFTSLPRDVIVLSAAAIHLLSRKYKTQDILTLVDWQLLVLFIALFAVNGIFEATGYEGRLVAWLESRGLDPSMHASEIGITAGLTAVIGNAAAVMLMAKLVPIAQPAVACIMAAANSFGGNTLLTASLANLIVVQQARRQGIVISFWRYARFGLPITGIALGGLYLWATLKAGP
jgi:Na+/H+ antiporter NhaD/arsenite permease-like protein